MKILYISIILFCALLAFFIPSMSEEESITISADKTSYAYGDNYTVSGKINPVISHEKVSIMVLSTNYPHPESFSVTPGSDGKYSYTLPLPIKNVPAGNFTIMVQYAGTKNQTSFNYAGVPCNQQNIPSYVISTPIIRGPPAFNPRILDSSGNAVIGPVKAGQQIQISYKLENGLNCNIPFVYLVQIQDHNGMTVSLSWITGTLPAGQSFYPAQSWMPQHNDTYTAQIFTWQSLDNPNALVPPASVSFVVVPNANFTQSSQIVSETTSKFSVGSQTMTLNFPLKQFRSGIAAKDVACRQGLQLIFKFEDSSPACVTEQTAQILVKRWWGMYVPAVTEHIPILSDSVKVPNTDFTINYNISGNNKLVDANVDSPSKSLILSLESTNNGTLIVSIPRALLDIKKNDRGMGEFYILADGQETAFKEIHTTLTDRTFSIPFQNGTKSIEIISIELV